MTPLGEHGARRAFGVAGRTELATFETVEQAFGGEEAEAALIACDDAGGAVVNFDDVGFGHGCVRRRLGVPICNCDAGVLVGSWSAATTTGAGRRRETATRHAPAHDADH